MSKQLKPIHYRRSELKLVLGLGLTKIDELIKSDRLPAYRIDGTVFVQTSDVENFIKECKTHHSLQLNTPTRRHYGTSA